MVSSITFGNSGTQLGNITKFRPIDGNVLRGSEPKTLTDLARLKQQGVDTVISFKHHREEQIIKPLSKLKSWITGKKLPTAKSIAYTPAMEAAACKQLGLKYVNIPMNVFNPFQGVSRSKMVQFLDEVGNASGKVYIHCRHGVERTGLMSALHKVSQGYTSAENAVRELVTKGGFRKFMYPAAGVGLTTGNVTRVIKVASKVI